MQGAASFVVVIVFEATGWYGRQHLHGVSQQAVRDGESFEGSKRSLTPAEMKAIEDKIRCDWAKVQQNPAEFALWTTMYKTNNTSYPRCLPIHEAIPAGLRGLVVPALVPAQPKFAGLWSDSQNVTQVVSVGTLNDFKNNLPAEADPSVVASKICVTSPVPSRKSELLRGWGSVFGCHSLKKNICGHAMPAERKASLDALTSRLNHWVDSLTVEQRESATELIMFRSIADFDHAEPLIVTALLVRPFFSPKAQVFADCAVVLASDSWQRATAMPDFPFDIKILERPSRLGRQEGPWCVWKAIALSTGSELASSLLYLRSHWQIVTLRYELCIGVALGYEGVGGGA